MKKKVKKKTSKQIIEEKLAHIKQLLKNENKTPIILAVDQALNYTAFSVFANGELLAYSMINTSFKAEYLKKIDLILEKTKELVSKYNVNIIINEDIYFMNAQTFKKLAFLLVSFEHYAYKNNIHQLTIHPMTIKAYIGALGSEGAKKRKEQKSLMVDYVLDKYNIDIEKFTEEKYPDVYAKKKKKGDFDIADAICIGDFVNNILESF